VTESAKAYERVIRLLTRRAHSRAELLRKLKDRGVQAEYAREAVDRAGREGYVNDLEFARLFAQQARDLKGWAPLRLKQALAQRGVATDHVEQAIEDTYSDVELLDLALAQARKRAARLQGDVESRRRRLAGYLQRRGFPAAVVRAATDDVAPL
jgi:regulatory protein